MMSAALRLREGTMKTGLNDQNQQGRDNDENTDLCIASRHSHPKSGSLPAVRPVKTL
jgi:hypothetical protein